MTDPKKDAKESEANTAKKQRKATTGAWWKSTVSIVENTEAASASTEAVSEPAAVKKKRPPRKPRAKRAEPEAEKPAKAAQKDIEQNPVSEPPQTKPSRPARKRSGRPSPRKQAALPDDTTNSEKVVAEQSENVESSQEVVVEELAAAEKKPGKSQQSRGRRGGRRKSTRQSSQEKKTGQVVVEEEQGTATATEQETDLAEDRRAESKPVAREKARDQEDAVPERVPVVKLLVNAEEPEECRLALLEDGRLESIHVSTAGRIQTRNNIYKARVVAIESNLQVAFVDYGTEKNGFLPFSEIHPEYYKQELNAEVRKLVEGHQWKKLSISDVMERGQELLVQVVKEEVGKKGANMTTYLSLPGRCVVLMPGSDSEGISRRISGEERRNQLREVMNSLGIPEGIGWIVRTASVDITKTALSKDVRFLLKLWDEIKAKGQHLDGVGLLYQDYNCVMRFLREYYDPSIQEILVDSEDALEKVRDFVEMLPAKQRDVRVKLHRGARPIFNQYSIEDQIESIYQPHVNLPSGGSIVIDPTEALVAIDVNSGSTGKGKNFEDTIFQANMEAATELARQLRLRDLGGLIVVDFIDMRNNKHVREVEKQVKNAMKRDKAKVDISRISRFGLMQISRQKLGSPIESSNYRVCEHCRGRGTVRSVETLALFYLRRIHTGASRKQVTSVDCHFPLDVAEYLLNNKRQELIELEEKYLTKVIVTADPTLKPAEHEIVFGKSEKEENGKKQA